MLTQYIKRFTTKSGLGQLPEDVDMAVKDEIEDGAGDNTAQLATQLASMTEAMSLMQTQLNALTKQYDTAQKALQAAEDEKVALAAKIASQRLEARTQAITKTVGTANLSTLLSVTDSLDDTQFNTLLGTMATSLQAEAKSPFFTEVGANVEVTTDSGQETEETEEMKLLRAKYATK